MTFRYSMIDKFLQCTKGFYETYILENKEKSDSSALHFGSAIHAALRAHHEDTDPIKVFEMYWQSIRDTMSFNDRYTYQDLHDMAVTKFIPNYVKLHAKKFTNVKVEETLEMPLWDGHVLQGTYDMCADFNGELTMVDFKTSASDYKISKLQKNPQLYIYSALYRHKYGILPKGVMYKVFVKSKESIQTQYLPLTEERLSLQMTNVHATIRNMLNMVETNDWYSNPGCYDEKCYKEMK